MGARGVVQSTRRKEEFSLPGNGDVASSGIVVKIVCEEYVWKLENVARECFTSEKTIRRRKICLLEYKGAICVPKTQISDLVLRLKRSMSTKVRVISLPTRHNECKIAGRIAGVTDGASDGKKEKTRNICARRSEDQSQGDEQPR